MKSIFSNLFPSKKSVSIANKSFEKNVGIPKVLLNKERSKSIHQSTVRGLTSPQKKIALSTRESIAQNIQDEFHNIPQPTKVVKPRSEPMDSIRLKMSYNTEMNHKEMDLVKNILATSLPPIPINK
jgi:hypothetical protein